MRIISILFISIYFILSSCITPKEARILKKTTKEWRDSPIVLDAWGDSPLSAAFLTLRENGKFEHTSSGIIQSFNAGTWTNNQDTIYLEYVNDSLITCIKQTVIIDRKTSTLQFEGDSVPVYMRLRIMINEIK